MIRNYIVTAYRSILKYRTAFVLNLSGLAVSITCALLIIVFVFHEFNYESDQPNRDNIFRLSATTRMEGQVTEFAANVPALGPALLGNIPEIKDYVRIRIDDFAKVVLDTPDKTDITGQNFYVVDSTFFRVFAYDFLEGSGDALKDPNQLVLTESLARKLFSTPPFTGKAVKLNKEHDFTVGAVIRDLPGNTHFKFQGLVPAAAFPFGDAWDDAHAYTYVLLSDQSDVTQLSRKIGAFVKNHEGVQIAQDRLQATFGVAIQPLADIHLYSNRNFELSENGQISFLFISLSIAVFFLLNAVINYINIAVASSINRTREVGVRKVFGALSGQIRLQYLVESCVMTCLAVLAGLVLTAMLLPAFGRLVSTPLSPGLLLNPYLVAIFVLLTLALSFVSGIYPAFYLSSFPPTYIFRSGAATKNTTFSLRNFLLSTQLTISTIVIISSQVVFSQLRYVRDKDLGFQKENVLSLDVPPGVIPFFREELARDASIEKVAASTYSPEMPNVDEHLIEGENGAMRTSTVQKLFVDLQFMDLMGMKVVKGRSFDPAFESDAENAFLVNEAAVKAFGWQNPIGKQIKALNYSKTGRVIGVVKNAHLYSLHSFVEPLIVNLSSEDYQHGEKVYVKIKDRQSGRAMGKIKAVFTEADGAIPASAYQFSFLDERYKRLYNKDEQLGQVLIISTIIMYVISFLGIYGMSDLAAVQRYKETGIRKLLGASTGHIFAIHLKRFLAIAVVSSTLSWLLGYYMMHRWLQTFASRTDIELSTLLVASLATIAIVISTVSIHAGKLSRANPIDAIRIN